MIRFLGPLVASALLSFTSMATAKADEADATPILDKAIAALGGEAKLAKAASASWSGTGTITFNDNESPIKNKTTVEGIDHLRGEFELEINGMTIKGLTVYDGTKGWRKFGDEVQDLDDEMLASTKQSTYLQAVPLTILPLKGKGFKVQAAADEKVGDKPAAVVKATGPDGKAFTLFFDKATGLPLKLTATVKGFQGDDVKQETTFADYKEFDGLKRATKMTSTRDGSPFVKMEHADFKVVEKPDAGTFAEPK